MLGVTGATGFPHVLRARGMRIFYSKRYSVENGVTWTTWTMSAGLNQFDPMFNYEFEYRDIDSRDEMAELLREFKSDFLYSVFGYYRENTCH